MFVDIAAFYCDPSLFFIKVAFYGKFAVNGTANTVEWLVLLAGVFHFFYMNLLLILFRISGKWRKKIHTYPLSKFFFFFFFIETWLIVLKNWLKIRYLRCSLLHSSLDSDAFHGYLPWPATSQAALPVSAKCVLKTGSGLPKITMEQFISVLPFFFSFILVLYFVHVIFMFIWGSSACKVLTVVGWCVYWWTKAVWVIGDIFLFLFGRCFAFRCSLIDFLGWVHPVGF